MSELDLRYVAARQILLDALVALNPHLHAVVVVGAHAVYLRTGDAGIAIAPFTTDADLALEPAILAERPELERLLRDAGFKRDGNKPGAWVASTTINGEEVPVPVDLMVPDAAAPKGSRRAVDLPGHDRMATRRATGLEAVLIDHDLRLIAALDPEDPRTVTVRVAGPTALIIAKLHKLHDRIDIRLRESQRGSLSGTSTNCSVRAHDPVLSWQCARWNRRWPPPKSKASAQRSFKPSAGRARSRWPPHARLRLRPRSRSQPPTKWMRNL